MSAEPTSGQAAFDARYPSVKGRLWDDLCEEGKARWERVAAAVLAASSAGPGFGIIDPDYARVFTVARCLAWQEGYALVMHGSFTRDLDLLAVPWTDGACEPGHLMRRIADAADLKTAAEEPGQKPHGRLAWTLLFKVFGDPRFVDLSVMPRLASTPALNREEADRHG